MFIILVKIVNFYNNNFSIASSTREAKSAPDANNFLVTPEPAKLPAEPIVPKMEADTDAVWCSTTRYPLIYDYVTPQRIYTIFTEQSYWKGLVFTMGFKKVNVIKKLSDYEHR